MQKNGILAIQLTDINMLYAADAGVTYSWDFSKAEEKEQEVRAAKAARGRARLQKAEKHSQRLHHQREKAATTLARLTALHPDASADTSAGTGNDDGAAIGAHQSSKAPFRNFLGKPDQEGAEQSPYQQHEHVSSNVDCIQQATDLDQHAAGRKTQQGCRLTGAHSMPAATSGDATSAMRPAFNRSDREGSERSNIGSAPLRRLASVAGYPSRQMSVPGPLLHSCAVESRRDSPSSMQSWQIVRPRPVQSEKAAVRRPSHVKVQG